MDCKPSSVYKRMKEQEEARIEKEREAKKFREAEDAKLKREWLTQCLSVFLRYPKFPLYLGTDTPRFGSDLQTKWKEDKDAFNAIKEVIDKWNDSDDSGIKFTCEHLDVWEFKIDLIGYDKSL